MVVPRVTLSAPQSLWLGDTVSLTVVGLPLPGAAVAVEALRAGQWTTGATATLGAGSRAVVSWRPPDYGPVHLRASLPEGAGSHRRRVGRTAASSSTAPTGTACRTGTRTTS